jgi:ribosomal protein L15
MKKLTFLTLLFLSTTPLFAQNTMSGLLSGSTKLTFLGLDFTQAKYIGKIGFTDAEAIKNQHMVSWNNLIEAEPKKFSLQKAFNLKADQYVSNVEDMVKLNKTVDVGKNITDDAYSITEDQVKKSVSHYSLGAKEGVGLVYVVESLNKTEEKLIAWVTFIDLSSKKVIYTEKVEGKAGGFGFRNYWAGGVFKINDAIDSKLYKKWSKSLK